MSPKGADFVSTELTRGPWDPDSQHAGPPAALIGRERSSAPDAPTGWQRSGGSPSRSCARCRSRRSRSRSRSCGPGARSSCSRRRSRDEDGEALIRARAWRLAEREVEIPAGLPPGRRAGRRARASGEEQPFFDTGQEVGYHTAMEYRFVRGALPRARAGDRVDADAPPAGRGRGADAAAARCWPPPTRATASARRSTSRATCSSTSTSPSTCTGCRRRVGLPRRDHGPASRTASGSPTRAARRARADRAGAADAARARALSVASGRRSRLARRVTLCSVGEWESITIVLADDHAVVRSALRLLLDAEHGPRGGRRGGRHRRRASATSRGHQPDVLILDLNMPGGPEHRARCPSCARPRRRPGSSC